METRAVDAVLSFLEDIENSVRRLRITLASSTQLTSEAPSYEQVEDLRWAPARLVWEEISRTADRPDAARFTKKDAMKAETRLKKLYPKNNNMPALIANALGYLRKRQYIALLDAPRGIYERRRFSR